MKINILVKIGEELQLKFEKKSVNLLRKFCF